MLRLKCFLFLQLSFCGICLPLAADWPQASGPHGNFIVAGKAVTDFSLVLDKNIRWVTPLPSTGQGGVIVVGDRRYLGPSKAKIPEARIVGHFDAKL